MHSRSFSAFGILLPYHIGCLWILSVVLFSIHFSPSFALYSTVSTFAGNATLSGESGDGGPASLALLRHPRGIGFGADGSTYITDIGSHVIRKVGIDGIITTVAGNSSTPGFCGDGGLATKACLNSPYGVFVEPNGDMLIADMGNDRIRKVFAVNGTIVTIAGNGTQGDSPDGTLATQMMMNNPKDVCLDAEGNIIFAETANSKVRKIFKNNGTVTSITSTTRPHSLFLEPEGSFLIAFNNADRIGRVYSNGTRAFIAGNGTNAPGCPGDAPVATLTCLSSPRAAVKSRDGNIYIAESGSFANRITVLKPDGSLSWLAGNGNDTCAETGSTLVPAKSACLSPMYMGLSPTGVLMIGDYVNRRVVQIKPNDCVTSWTLSTIPSSPSPIHIFDPRQSSLTLTGNFCQMSKYECRLSNSSNQPLFSSQKIYKFGSKGKIMCGNWQPVTGNNNNNTANLSSDSLTLSLWEKGDMSVIYVPVVATTYPRLQISTSHVDTANVVK